MQNIVFETRPLREVLHPADLSGQGTRVDQIYELLRRQIINLSLPPETALAEQELAGVLKVSKTPVREAIIRLSREQLVQVIPKSGSYVTPVSLDRYLVAIFVRTQLEVGCVRRLAKQGVSLAEQVKLQALLTEQTDAIDLDDELRFFELDEALHRRFFELAGLAGAWETMNASKAELDRVRHLKRRFGFRQRDLVVQEHAALVDAIINRDPDEAAQCMTDNIGAVDEEVLTFAQNPQLLRTIEELNELAAMDGRARGRNSTAKT